MKMDLGYTRLIVEECRKAGLLRNQCAYVLARRAANAGYANYEFTSTATGGTGVHSHAFTTDAAGSGSAHNNVQPTAVVNFIIKT